MRIINKLIEKWMFIVVILFTLLGTVKSQTIRIELSCETGYSNIFKVCDACGESGTPVWEYSNGIDEGAEIKWRSSLGKWEVYLYNLTGEAYFVSQSNNRTEFPPCLQVGNWELTTNWDYCDDALDLIGFEYDDGRCDESILVNISCLPRAMIIPRICEDCGDSGTPVWNYSGEEGEIEIAWGNLRGQWFLSYGDQSGYAIFSSQKGNNLNFPPCLEIGAWQLLENGGTCEEWSDLEDFAYVDGQCGKSIILEMSCPVGELIIPRSCDDCGENGTPVWEYNDDSGEAVIYWDNASDEWILNFADLNGYVTFTSIDGQFGFPPCQFEENWLMMDNYGYCNNMTELLRFEYLDGQCEESIVAEMTCPPGSIIFSKICDNCGPLWTSVWTSGFDDIEASISWDNETNSWTIVIHNIASDSYAIFSSPDNNNKEFPPCLDTGNWTLKEFNSECDESEELLRLEYIGQACIMIPTMTTWGVITLMMLLLICGSLYLKYSYRYTPL